MLAEAGHEETEALSGTTRRPDRLGSAARVGCNKIRQGNTVAGATREADD